MQTSVVQQAVNVKPIFITLAFAWGFEDGAQGKSEYEGYQYFVGPLLSEYRKGHQAGKAIMLHKQMQEALTMPAEFAEALDDLAAGTTYATGSQYHDEHGNLDDEPGYCESRQPYLY